MAEPVHELFDEFASSFARGERPDAPGYLTRAGEGAGELAGLIDAFLRVTVPPPPDEEARARVRAVAREQEQPTLLQLRLRAGLKRDAVVDALIAALGLAAASREKVKGYYHELEWGKLDPDRVSRRVTDALASLLHAPADGLLAWHGAVPPAPAVAYYRTTDLAAVPPPLPATDEPQEWDEVDELFRGPRPAQ